MKKKSWIELSKIKKYINSVRLDKQSNYKEDLCSLVNDHFTNSKKFRIAELLYDIYITNDTNCISLYNEYKQSDDAKRKISIRHGEDAVIIYESKLKNRPISENRYNGFSKDYWISKGMSKSNATAKVSDIQTKNAKKRKTASYKNHSTKIKHSVDYWTNLGYSVEESEILRVPYLQVMDNSLDGFILRYGEELGAKKYLTCRKSYSDCMLENLGNRRTGGYVSKESIEFFIPLYKFCRKLGIPRNYINFGIKGSREFFIRDNSKNYNSGFFYDFTISRLRIVIEYNGTYWHPREAKDWKSAYCDYQTALNSDRYKQKIAEDFGMVYNIIWSDDNKDQKMQEYKELITKLWNQYESTKL